MKTTVELICVECGKVLGQVYGNFGEEIAGSKYVLCPSTPNSACCQMELTEEEFFPSYLLQ